jgi:eukaryotic-like serine/threonine-protein kinase
MGNIIPPWRNDRYELIGPLGRGSFGHVYLAYDSVLDRQVALKRLLNWHPTLIKNLRREFHALKDLDHPNLVTLYELHADEHEGFLTMEVVEGQDVVTYVREGGDLAERRERARDCLAQLVEAVCALHAQDTLHRDLKPSNVLVTADGRVVVLDAGLARRTGAQQPANGVGSGTVAYMAPEPETGTKRDEARDWYSVGVMAYELFSGELPFKPTRAGFISANSIKTAPSIAKACPDLSPEDVLMVDALLASDPLKRPQGETLRGWLNTGAKGPAPPRPTRPLSLVGRQTELALLDQALERAREQGLAVVELEGASGIGKTALVRHWLGNLDPNEVLPLAGRCYQRETVPFGGFEDIFSALTRRLTAEVTYGLLTPDELASLEHALGRLEGLDEPGDAVDAPPSRRPAPRDPLERRRLMGSAFAQLLGFVAGSRTVVLWLDDLQWASEDTALLVADLAREPWPRGLAIVLGHTPLGSGDGACLRTLLARLEITHPLTLGPLPDADAGQLVCAALGSTQAAPERAGGPAADGAVGKLLAGGAGHPLLLEQAARWLLTEGDAAADLAGLFLGRVAGLSPEAGALLRVLSVAAGPLSEATALKAAGPTASSEALRVLRAAGLVRRVGRLGHDVIPFHEQLRVAVRNRLSDEEKRALNRAIADALEQNGRAEPEGIVGYLLAADERQRATHYVTAAAENMARALAFERAVHLYRIALDLESELPAGKAQGIRLALAGALVNAGRTEEGARMRLEAAEGLPESERDPLIAQAARELVRAGRIDEGLHHAHKTFARLGLRLSRSAYGSLPAIAFDRLRLRLGRMLYQVRDAEHVPPHMLERVDWCQALTVVLPVVDTLRALEVHNQGLCWALKAGEPGRLGQALAMEAGFRTALAGGMPDPRVDELLGAARLLSRASRDHRAIGIVEIIAGSTRWSAADWKGCVEHIKKGVALLRRHCTDVSWEVNFGQTHALDALSWMGELAEARRVLLDELKQAAARGDLYAQTMYTLRDLPTLRMIEDQPDEARACSEALKRWTNRGFHVEHMVDVYKQTEVDLYLGRGLEASARIEAHWPKLDRAQLMRLQPFRVELTALRGRAAVAAAEALAPGPEREQQLRLATRLVSELDRETTSTRGAVFGAPVAAAVAFARRDLQGAARRLERGADKAQKSGMRLHEQVLRGRLGALRGGEAGREAQANAEAWMRSAEVKNPERYARVLCPGFGAA